MDFHWPFEVRGHSVVQGPLRWRWAQVSLQVNTCWTSWKGILVSAGAGEAAGTWRPGCLNLTHGQGTEVQGQGLAWVECFHRARGSNSNGATLGHLRFGPFPSCPLANVTEKDLPAGKFDTSFEADFLFKNYVHMSP